MLFTAEHDEARRALQKFIAAEINPFVDEWEKTDIFPAHALFKKLGDLGFLGLNKPVAFGGQGLDYSYALMMAEELGAIRCGGVPMAIGVQTDMATPALARFGSDEVRKEFLAPSIAGDFVACIGVSEQAVDFDALDREPCRIFIMTLSPADKTGPHLQFLAEVSLLFRSEEKRAAILAATSPEEVLKVLTA